MGFSLVIDVGKSVLDLLIKGKKLQSEEREITSKILLQISEIINSTVEKFKKDEFPHSHCQSLSILSQNLHDVLKSHLTPDQSEELLSCLMESAQIEREFASRDDQKTIEALEKAAGTFLAWSILVKKF